MTEKKKTEKEKYWDERITKQEFLMAWKAWRNKCKLDYGPRFVVANPSMFTQAAFKAWIIELNRQADIQDKLSKETGDPVPEDEFEIETTATD